MFNLYSCQNHYGVGDEGLTTSIDYLKAYDPSLQMVTIEEVTKEEDDLPNLKNLNSVRATCQQIAEYAQNVFHKNLRPLFIAGDHSAAMGSVSATSSAFDGPVGLIWIDAHPDINTDKTTVTGNIHGMPVAALLGLGEPSLTNFLNDHPKIRPEHIVMIGLRDIDPPEAQILAEQHIRYYTWNDLKKTKLDCCLKETAVYLKDCQAIHLSFDIDSMNPLIMPGVSVPVPGGFNKQEVLSMISFLIHELPIESVDIVEFNHIHDINDQTAEFVSTLIHTLLTTDCN